MKYLSDYALGEEFIITPQIAEKLGNNFTNFLNAKCYVEMIDISSQDYMVAIKLSEDYIDATGYIHKQDKYINTVEYTIDDYYKNQNLIHTIPSCANVNDVIIDAFTRRFFEIKRIIATYENGKVNITYCTKSSNPDDDTVCFTEDKLKFFIDNNIYRHAKWDMSDTPSDTSVENK